MKGNRIFLSQNDTSYVTYINFAPNTPSTANTAKFDCLDFSGPPCRGRIVFTVFCILILSRLHKMKT